MSRKRGPPFSGTASSFPAGFVTRSPGSVCALPGFLRGLLHSQIKQFPPRIAEAIRQLPLPSLEAGEIGEPDLALEVGIKLIFADI